MKMSSLAALVVVVLFAVALPAYAEGGCVNSPENPTAVLAVVGSAGALFTLARARFKARR